MNNVDGTEWYFPQRLTNDTRAVNAGNASPAQTVLGLHATMGHNLPKNLLIYAFGAALGGPAVPAAARSLAAQSQIPASNLTLVDRAEHLRAQRPGRRVSPQRLLRSARAVPAEGRRAGVGTPT